jgi:hypothetical protein
MFICDPIIITGMLFAQRHPVDPSERYYRLICLVHLAGSGTLADPFRPEYVPDAADANGICVFGT